MTEIYLPVLIAILAALFLWGIGGLITCFLGSYWLIRNVARMRNQVLDSADFSGSRHSRALAAAIAKRVRSVKNAAHLDADRELVGLSSSFFAGLARVRALSGLLIIIGLLITLSNLRSAVDDMQQTVNPSSRVTAPIQPGASAQTDTVAPEARVREGIGGVAEAAGRAFLYSTFAIGAAAVIMFLSILAQRAVTSALGTLRDWLIEQHDALLAKDVAEPLDTALKLGQAADTLVQVAKTFEETNTALSGLRSFGSRLDDAADTISRSVAGLPGQIDSSMTKISGDVAHGIRSGLEHQGEYLKSLVTIYSEHALVVQQTVEFVKNISEVTKRASESLVALEGLPTEIRGVSVAASEARGAAQQLAASVQALDKKVAVLPSADLARAATTLATATERVTKLEDDVASLGTTIKASVKDAVSDVVHRGSAGLSEHVDTLAVEFRSIAERAATNAASQSQAVQSGLSRVGQAVDRLASTSRPDGVRTLQSDVEDLTTAVNGLPSRRFMRAVDSIADFFRRR